MIKRKLGKKNISRFFSLGLCFSLVLTSFGNSGLTVYAEETQEVVETQEESSSSATDTILIEDKDSTGMYYNASSEMRDFRDETIYFVMTTRFYDGDSSNNVQCWDAQSYNQGDEPWRGDFKGLIEKLDYIKALGFTSIWITPVVENASGYDYHGYHAYDFSKVDPRYESDGCTYQDLIDAAHAKGMKVIQDVVLNHTGNWGEKNLLPIATKDYSQDLSDCVASMKIDKKYGWDKVFSKAYESLDSDTQFKVRCQLLMNGTYDTNNIYHHNDFIKGWETYDEQITSIAGDCIDLNTENPKVYHYLVDCYSQYIKMGVDAFRVDTVKHISRLTYNNAFISELNDAYNEVHGTTGEGNFYMFGEVCTRVRDIWNKGVPALSCPFYTWKETKKYAWDDSETDAAIATNEASVKQAYEDNKNVDNEPTSNNAFLSGNSYHTPDYSKASGLNVIDFPMHWNFQYARDAFGVAVNGDKYYNDATYNVTYVDSHDYAPDGAPENQRFNGTQAQWAENLSLMFTFRGIPCIYYGSEVEFQKGKTIDGGNKTALADTGRAYFGDYIEGSVDVVDFATYTNATGKMAETLKHPLSQHIQRLNRLRAAIPALRKGQYSTEGCNGSSMAFKRRYTDAATDSFVLVTVSGNATFSGIPNGRYTDAITGDVKNVTNGTLSTSGVKGQGDLRVYVLDTDKTKAPGMIAGYSNYLSGGCDVVVNPVDPTGITLDKTSAQLDLGDTATFTATVAPSDATNKTVTWTSSNTKVATVSNGKVTAKSEGTTTITATTSNGIKKTATVTVKATGIKVDSVTLSQKAVTLEAGKTAKVTATIAPSNATPKYAKLTWTSSNTAVATVSSDGLITGVKKGTATITATTVTGVSASVAVQVNGPVIYGDAIHFEKPSGWGNKINVYFWLEDGSKWTNAGWPGVAMTETGDGVYSIEWPEGKENASLKVIFNDGSNQTANLTAKLNGYYTVNGYVKYVEPVQRPGNEVTIEISNEVFTYDGTEKKLPVAVKDGTTVLTENVDYILTYQNNVNAGTATVTVTGMGDYANRMPANNTFTYTIEKAEIPANVPVAMAVAANTKLSDVELGGNWTWSDADKNRVVKANETVTVTAVYVGADKANYKTVSVTLSVKGQNCNHNGGTEVRNAVTATCTTAGYTGDTYCKDCGAIIATGSSVAATGHKWNGGVITTQPTETTAGVRTYTCTQCLETKTEVIPPTGCTHASTTVKNKVAATCTTAGYTGDTYCTKCNTVIATGSSVAATGHKWDNGKITTQPTETAAGVKTYTCTQCTATTTEVIPPTGEVTVVITTEDTDLKKGDAVTDTATGTIYRITKSSASAKTVEYMTAANKQVNVVVPDKVIINGVTYKVTAIADNACKNKQTVKTVVIGKYVTTIGKNAFKGCKKLKTVTMNTNVTTINNNAFYNCTSLTSITIPYKVSKIGKNAFYGCKKLTSITVKTTKLTSKNVGANAFKGVSGKATIKVSKAKVKAYKTLFRSKGLSKVAKVKAY